MDNVLNLKDLSDGDDTTADDAAPHGAVVDDGEILGPQSVSWQSQYPPHETRQRKRYVAFGVFALVGGTVAVWQASILMGVLVAVGIAAWEVHERFAQPVDVTIDADGLQMNGQHYLHAELTSFDIHHMPDGTADVSIKTRKWHMPDIHLPLSGQDHETVAAVLSRHVPRERHPVSRLDHWMRS